MNGKINKDYKFTFGMYKGKNLIEVINDNVMYVVWCTNHIDWFKLDEQIYNGVLKENYVKLQRALKRTSLGEDVGNNEFINDAYENLASFLGYGDM